MAKLCLRCSKVIPKRALVNNKIRNFQRRKYCFDCSPFGMHNTGQLHRNKITKRRDRTIICPCGKESKAAKGTRCYSCRFKSYYKKKLDFIYAILGESCWICNYNKGELGRQILSFHHVYPKLKFMGLSAREISGHKWELIWNEIQKCVLLCRNCHGEVHAGIIDNNFAIKLYEDRWSKIDTNVSFDKRTKK